MQMTKMICENFNMQLDDNLVKEDKNIAAWQ